MSKPVIFYILSNFFSSFFLSLFPRFCWCN